jgi:hypothetical protein
MLNLPSKFAVLAVAAIFIIATAIIFVGSTRLKKNNTLNHTAMEYAMGCNVFGTPTYFTPTWYDRIQISDGQITMFQKQDSEMLAVRTYSTGPYEECVFATRTKGDD